MKFIVKIDELKMHFPPVAPLTIQRIMTSVVYMGALSIFHFVAVIGSSSPLFHDHIIIIYSLVRNLPRLLLYVLKTLTFPSPHIFFPNFMTTRIDFGNSCGPNVTISGLNVNTKPLWTLMVSERVDCLQSAHLPARIPPGYYIYGYLFA